VGPWQRFSSAFQVEALPPFASRNAVSPLKLVIGLCTEN
jgi:hypothetical protein